MVMTVLIKSVDAASPFINPVENVNEAVVLLIVYVLLALVFSFLCSVAESVLLSLTPSYIEEQKEKQPKRAALLTRLRQENVDRSLAAILTLNTIAHTVGAIGAGAQATVVFGSAWFGLFSAVMTLMILFLSEIIPKTIGAIYWSKLAGPTAFFVNSLIVVLYPIVWVSERMTKFISHGKNVHVFSRDEFIAMARIGEQTGQILDNEARMIRNLFRFGSMEVTDIMTPRTVISALPEDMTVADGLEYIEEKPFSRLPVYKTDIDDICGFVLKDEVLSKKAQVGSEATLQSLKRNILVVPESVSLTALLEMFLKDRQHIAIVVDEYGGTTGLVTLEDLVETLIGMEIADETDTVIDMRVLARKQWEERARTMGISLETANDSGSVETKANMPSKLDVE
jgi:CBS domain containing-hemolysin-like protein